MRSEFENSIKWSSSYEKLVYQHGERLFIFDDGKYKIAAVQLAWEMFKEKQTQVNELKKENLLLESGQKSLFKQHAELQKRLDAALWLLKVYRDEMDHGFEVSKATVKKLEQALKGER